MLSFLGHSLYDLWKCVDNFCWTSGICTSLSDENQLLKKWESLKNYKKLRFLFWILKQMSISSSYIPSAVFVLLVLDSVLIIYQVRGRMNEEWITLKPDSP